MVDVVKGEYVWEQKFRPRHVKDVIVPEMLQNEILKFVEKKQIPHFLFYSPMPGSGKTTMAKAISNDLGVSPLFINASLNNSIDDIRSLVVQYATTISVFGGDGHKIVILDEAERLSANALDALKGLMEEVSKHCRFIITTNSKARIPEPLRSRCTEIDFIWSKDEQLKVNTKMYQRVLEILEYEGVTFDKRAVAVMVKKFSPDNRKILNTLQKYAITNNEINEGILAHVQTADIGVLVEHLKEKSFPKVKQWCMDNQSRFHDDFYWALKTAITPQVEPQQEVALIMIVGNEQKFHQQVGDKHLHVLQMCIQIMSDITFKK